MRLRLSLLGLMATVVLVVWAGLAGGLFANSVGAVSQREAAEILQPLVDDWEVDLSSSQRQLVAFRCLEIQAKIIEPARQQLEPAKTKYQQFLALAGGYIWGLTNQLDAFSDDASNLNLAMVELRRFHIQFEDSFIAYERSLTVVGAVDCLAYPEHFVAGLIQVRATHQTLATTASDLVEFVSHQLPAAFTATECHLFDSNQPQCH